jgi:hypothetical protein
MHREKRNSYRILVGTPDENTPLGRPRHRWEDNIKMDIREIRWVERVAYTGRRGIHIGFRWESQMKTHH